MNFKMFFYFNIVKPRIIFGNLVSMLGGFFLASKGVINFKSLLFSILGLTLIIASSCILNNIIDRDIDCLMNRTKNRILIKFTSIFQKAIVYSIALGLIGLSFFYFFLNFISIILVVLGFLFYVIIYSLYLKRITIYSTIIGGFSGSMPPVIGYCIVKNNFDFCAIILFLIFLCWQVAHFYAISILYKKDFNNINLPIFIIKKGFLKTVLNIFFHILLFFLTIFLFYYNNFVGFYFFLILSFLIFFWLIISLMILYVRNRLFFVKINIFFSIFIVCVFSILISLDYK